MKSLEEITYEAGRDALADQERIIADLRQRTGTVLAAKALIASFLGAAVIRAGGLQLWGWLAVATLVTGLVLAAIVLSPWKMKFALDARLLYEELYDRALTDFDDESSSWLAAAGFLYQQIREENSTRVRLMAALATSLSALLVVQTLFWLLALALDSRV